MDKIRLGNSSLEVSRLCFGGCPMGGHGWGDVSKSELINAVKKAVEIGVNFFDSADVYGLGEGERTLGEALTGIRDKAIIATKFGVRVENGKTFYDNSPAWINKAVRDSLDRLKTDYIDLYQVHYRDFSTPISEVINELEKLKSSGYIKHYGLSNIHEKDLHELKYFKGRFVSFQDEYSLVTRKNEKDMIVLSKELDMTPLTWGSLGQGILTGKYDKNIRFSTSDRRSRDVYENFHGEKLIRNLEIVEVLKDISLRLNKPVSAIAIRWILDHLPNSVVIAGIKNTNQLLGNFEALGWQLSDEDLALLGDISKEIK